MRPGDSVDVGWPHSGHRGPRTICDSSSADSTATAFPHSLHVGVNALSRRRRTRASSARICQRIKAAMRSTPPTTISDSAETRTNARGAIKAISKSVAVVSKTMRRAKKRGDRRDASSTRAGFQSSGGGWYFSIRPERINLTHQRDGCTYGANSRWAHLRMAAFNSRSNAAAAALGRRSRRRTIARSRVMRPSLQK